MAIDTVKKGKATDLVFLAGDDEFIRLNLRDSDGVVINIKAGYVAMMGIKRKISDDYYVIPQKEATLYTPNDSYIMQFDYGSLDTIALLNYNNTEREKVELVYDIELFNQFGAERTTILRGNLNIFKTVASII